MYNVIHQNHVLQHIDFLRIRADQKLHMHVPLHFIGEDKAPGVKDGGIINSLNV